MKEVLLYVGWVLPAVVGMLLWGPLWFIWFLIPLVIMAWVDAMIAFNDVDPQGKIIFFFYDFMSEEVPDRIPPEVVPVKVLEIGFILLRGTVVCVGLLIFLIGETLWNRLQSFEDYSSPSGY